MASCCCGTNGPAHARPASPAGYVELGRAEVLAGRNLLDCPALSRGRLFLPDADAGGLVFVGSPGSAAARSLPPMRPSASVAAPWRIDWNWLLAASGIPFRPARTGRVDRLVRARCWRIPARHTGRPAGPLGCASPKVGRELPCQAVFWSACLLLGHCGELRFSIASAGRFVFTCAVWLVVRSSSRLAGALRLKGRPRASGCKCCRFCRVAFVAVALVYFSRLPSMGLALEWCFLWGLYRPAAGIPAARRWPAAPSVCATGALDRRRVLDLLLLCRLDTCCGRGFR